MKRFGFPGVVSFPAELVYAKGIGWRTIKRWSGTDDQMRAVMSACAGALDLRFEPSVLTRPARMTATFGGTDEGTPEEMQIESEWELDENQGDLTIWKHPKVQAIFGAYDVNQQARLRADIEKFALGQQQDSEYGDQMTSLLLNSEDFRQFLMRLTSSNGQATYYSPDAVLRHTLTGPITWRYQFDWNDVATLTSSAEIEAAEPSLSFGLPPGRTWLFRFPRLVYLNNGKLQVQREWWECANDTWLYLPMT